MSVVLLARIAQTHSQSWGDKFVIGEEFMRPWNRNRKLTTNWENWLPEKTLQRPLSLWGGDRPPHESAIARNRGNVQVIVRKDMMRLSFLREQLVRSSEQLVLVDTKKGFLGPAVYQSPYCCIMVRCSAALMCPLKGHSGAD